MHETDRIGLATFALNLLNWAHGAFPSNLVLHPMYLLTMTNKPYRLRLYLGHGVYIFLKEITV